MAVVATLSKGYDLDSIWTQVDRGLGREQQLVDVSCFPAAVRVPAELGAIGRLAFAEQQVVRLALDPLARLEAERFRARAPPPAGWFSPALAGLNVVAGRAVAGPRSTFFQM